MQSRVPSLLVDGRKCHLRAYVVALGAGGGGDARARLYAYARRVEVRLATARTSAENADDLGDARAHLTTGAWRRDGAGARDGRTTLDRAPELAAAGVAPARVVAVLRDALGGAARGATRRGVSDEDASFGIAGVDVMVDPAGRLYVLEVNASPAAPPPETISSEHAEHLAGFVRDLSRLLVSAGRDCAACGFECLAKE